MIMVAACAARVIDADPQDEVTIQDIVEFRDFSGVAACSSSGLIAARVDRPGIHQNRIDHEWRIFEWPSGKARFTVNAGETLNTIGFPERSFPQWSQDCHWLYYRALHDGEVQIWRLNAKSGSREKVTSDDADILNFALIQAGRSLVYQTSASRTAIRAAEAREYRNGILIDKNIWPLVRLTRTFPIYGRWAPHRRWSVREYGHLLSREPPKYNTISIQDRKVRTARESEIAKLTEPDAGWAPQPSSGFLSSPKGEQAAVVITEKSPVHEYPVLNRLAAVQRENPSEINECGDDRCMAKQLVPLKWSQDESSIYFIAEQKRGTAGIYDWTPKNGNVRTIVETNGLLGALSSGSRSHKSGPCPFIEDIAFCTSADPENPPRLVAIPLASGSPRIVFDPNSDLRKRFSLIAERISWKDKLNRDALGVLIYPRHFRSGTRYPLIITTYRCPGFLAGGVADGGPEYVLAENGFLVLCIDYNRDIPRTLSAKMSKSAAQYMAALSEYESAVEFLAEKGLADRDRVGVTGMSFSAATVSYALTHSEVFTVASLRTIGVLEPANEMFFRTDMALAKLVNKRHGIVNGEQDKGPVYEDLAVTLRATRVTAPTLVQASDSEYLGSLSAFAALQKLDKPIEMIVFPDETHHLFQPMHRYVNFTRNLDWFRFWLQGYEDPNPKKQNQYTRWKKMRDDKCTQQSTDSGPYYCRQRRGDGWYN